ncbi:MAG: C40 family peptidase [Rhodanobacteraceae bacterium]
MGYLRAVFTTGPADENACAPELLPRVRPAGNGTLIGAQRRLFRLLAPALALLLGACATTPPPPATAANDVLFRAIGLVGTPYHFGGNTPASGFDCSGLVDYVFRSAGVALPRNSREIADMDAPKIRNDRLAPGDLLFFGRHGHVNHVAIYVGQGRFVHAPNTGGTVRLDQLDGYYWRNHFLYAKRVLAWHPSDSAVASN